MEAVYICIPGVYGAMPRQLMHVLNWRVVKVASLGPITTE